MIGGFPKKNFYKKKKKTNNRETICLNGRSSFSLILNYVKPNLIYIPFYICNTILDILKSLNIKYKFYKIDNRFKNKSFKLLENQWILKVPFFGIIKQKNEKNSIFDLSTSFFYDISSQGIYFNSLRKFFHVRFGSNINLPIRLNLKDASKDEIDRFKLPKNFKEFRTNEKKHFVLHRNVKKHINQSYFLNDFKKVKNEREINFKILHRKFKKLNMLKINLHEIQGPLYYPLLVKNGIIYKKKLNYNKIYNPTLWSEITKRKNSHKFQFECNLAKNCIFLPVNEKISKKQFKKLYEILEIN